MCSEQKLDKTLRANIFNSTGFLAMLYASEKRAIATKNSNWLQHKRAIKGSMLGISLRKHIRSKLMRERREGCDRGVPKAEALLGKVH